MQLLPVMLAVVLGILAFAFVLYPLYRPDGVKTRSLAVATEDVLVQGSAATEREQTARLALQEVELDYQLGNLAESDYRSLRERYTRRAIQEMKSRYDHEQELELDGLIEERLRKMREDTEEPVE